MSGDELPRSLLLLVEGQENPQLKRFIPGDLAQFSLDNVDTDPGRLHHEMLCRALDLYFRHNSCCLKSTMQDEFRVVPRRVPSRIEPRFTTMPCSIEGAGSTFSKESEMAD